MIVAITKDQICENIFSIEDLQIFRNAISQNYLFELFIGIHPMLNYHNVY